MCDEMRLKGFLLAGAFGSCVYLVIGCGEISSGPDGANAGVGGNLSGGAGGGASVAEAGVGGGGALADAGSDAADGVAGSQGGPPVVPADCPTPAPVAAPDQVIALQSININTREMVLRNVSQTDQTIMLGRQGWQWCSFPNYWSLRDGDEAVVLSPGETFAFIAFWNQSGIAPIFPEGGEMAIYSGPGLFQVSTNMQAFVSWGEIDAIRENLAVEKLLWTFGDRIELRPGHAGFIATGPTDQASGYTSARAACLVAPVNR